MHKTRDAIIGSLSLAARHTLPQNQSGHVAVAAPTKIQALLSLPFDLHYLAGNALPLTAALHPSVSETERAIEWFAVLGRALFMRCADNDCDAWTIAVRRELFIYGRLVCVFISLDLGNNP